MEVRRVMDAFDILTENQIKSWEKRKAEGKDTPAKNPTSGKRSSFEAMLYRSILDLYKQMASVEAGTKQYAQLDRRSENLKAQLLVSMERQKMFINSQIFSQQLLNRKAEILGKQKVDTKVLHP
jgi:hypothetical protein